MKLCLCMAVMSPRLSRCPIIRTTHWTTHYMGRTIDIVRILYYYSPKQLIVPSNLKPQARGSCAFA